MDCHPLWTDHAARYSERETYRNGLGKIIKQNTAFFDAVDNGTEVIIHQYNICTKRDSTEEAGMIRYTDLPTQDLTQYDYLLAALLATSLPCSYEQSFDNVIDLFLCKPPTHFLYQPTYLPTYHDTHCKTNISILKSRRIIHSITCRNKYRPQISLARCTTHTFSLSTFSLLTRHGHNFTTSFKTLNL